MQYQTAAVIACAMGVLLSATCLSHATATSFQEGVLPTGAYTHDAVYIRDGQPTTNQDGSDQIIIGTTVNPHILRGLFEFDISTISASDSIDSVSLELTTHSSGGLDAGGEPGDPTFHVFTHAFDIDETTATWNVPGGGAPVGGSTNGTLLSSVSFDPTQTGQAVTFVDTAAFRTAVANALAADGILRLIVAKNDESTTVHEFTRIAAESFGTSGDRPKLVITHTTPPPSGSVIWAAPGVSNITATTADAYATLGGTNAEVALYWKQGGSAPQQHTGWDGTNALPAGNIATGLVERAMTGLNADALYSFIFYGTNSTVQTEGWSDAGSVTTALSSAQAPVFTNATVSGTTITLGWQDNASYETAYVLMRSTNAVDYTTITTLVANVESHVDGGLVPATYYYRLAATNAGNESVTDFAACQTNATTEVTGFQEGVLPTPAYTHDAVYIRTDTPDANQNADPDQEMIVGFVPGVELRGLVEFDVSSIPAVNTIDGVSLILRRSSGGEGPAITVNVYEYDYDFDETTATWNAPGSGDGTAGGTLGTLLTSATFDPTSPGDIAFADATAFRTAVSDALGGDGVLRMIIARSDGSGTGNRYVRFDDETISPAINRPELQVSHQPPPAGAITWSGVGVSNITADAADAYATLGGTNAEVALYWKQGSSAPQQHTGWDGTNALPAGNTATGLVERAMSGLDADALYSFIFYGTNSTAQTEAWSDAGSVTTALSSAQAPVFTSAVGGNGTVTLGWADNASYESAYLLQRSDSGSGGPYAIIGTLAADTVTYPDSGLASGTYYYRLAATNAGNGSVTDFTASQTSAVVVVIAPPSSNIADYALLDLDVTSADSELNSTAADFTKNPASADWGFSSSGDNAFARSTATTASEAAAVGAGDYFSFTVTPAAGYELDLTQLTFDTIHNATDVVGSPDTGASMKFFVRSSADAFAVTIGTTYTQAWNTTTMRTQDLSNATFRDLDSATEFRIYIYDSGVDNPVNGARLDNIVLKGVVVPTGTTVFQEGVSSAVGYEGDATFIHAGATGSNFDGFGELIAGPNASGFVIRSLLEFDLTTVPAFHAIDSVGLRLVTSGTAGAGGVNTFVLHTYDKDIDETTATWLAPDVGDTDIDGGTLGTLLTSTSFDATVTGLEVTFGSTAAFRTAAQNALLGDGILRLILANSDEATANNFARFLDDEQAQVFDRPKITVLHHSALSVFSFR